MFASPPRVACGSARCPTGSHRAAGDAPSHATAPPEREAPRSRRDANRRWLAAVLRATLVRGVGVFGLVTAGMVAVNGGLFRAPAAAQAPPAGSQLSPATPAVPAPVNNVLPLLDADKPIFGQFVNYLGVGSDRESAVGHAANRDFDFVVYDLEHTPFDIPRLTEYLQWLLDRRAIAEAGLTATKTVFVRMPVNARETNEWVTKNVLDTGVHGLVFPHTETVEQVLHAIRTMRYPQAPGVADAEPAGIRGASPAIAARYWGLTSREYQQRADIWRLDPGGSLIPIFIIENRTGVENARAIAQALSERNIGAILWAGSGDMTVSYAGDQAAVAAGLDRVIDAGREFGLPVGINGTVDLEARYAQGVRMFVSIGVGGLPPTSDQRQAVGR
ncbi:MAG: aldolase/citrate lyase family protein [Acidobacteria bacterium]|nr:aldolase/citrate lyase family protein [Acidobacteriota bacterium]